MNFKVVSEGKYPYVVAIMQNGEKLKLERGSMIFQDTSIELVGKTGGLGKALARGFLAGESVFITEAVAHGDNAMIGIGPKNIGDVKEIHVTNDEKWYLSDGSFLASEESVDFDIVSQSGITKSLFSGTGGLFIMKTKGEGKVFLESFGAMDIIELDGSKKLIVDTDHAVAWSDGLEYTVRAASGTFGFKSGEGLVMEFSGTGKILMNSRNIKTFASGLSRYLPTRR